MVNDLRNGFGLGFDRNLIHFSRYKIVGSRSEGKYVYTDKQTTRPETPCDQAKYTTGVTEVRTE